jgi:hypothetical protein
VTNKTNGTGRTVFKCRKKKEVTLNSRSRACILLFVCFFFSLKEEGFILASSFRGFNPPWPESGKTAHIMEASIVLT